MSKRIFVIDDEPDMIKIAADLLQSDGYMVVSDTNPINAIQKCIANPPDLIILDVRLPELDGFQVCKQLKAEIKTKYVPVIMVSVKSDETDVVLGLEVGAEDYISKPFRKRELLARVKTALRRGDSAEIDQRIEVGPVEVDYGAYKAYLNKKQIELTPKEFELLGFLMKREGRVTTRVMISESIWRTEYMNSTRTIDVHVDQLRRKLGKHATMIKSLKGIGYRFETDD